MIFLDLLSENDFRTVDSQPTLLSCETRSLPVRITDVCRIVLGDTRKNGNLVF